MRKIKIFLSDPQVLFREGIHFILSGEDDFEVTGETASNEEALAFIEANPPNLAILSMQNGKLTGPAVTRRIKRRFPAVSVVLITDKYDDEQLFTAMKSGASACLTKDADPEHLLDTIRVVTQGSQPIIEALLTPKIASRALIEFEDLTTLNEQLEDMLASLTTKETEILNSIAAGNVIEQITVKLDISEESVRHNLRLIRDKLMANDQARDIIEATQRGLPSIIHGTVKTSGLSEEYVTREEFNRFKESLAQRLKNFIGEAV
jgi:DNA-binding NarL/FixJ family response regulator